MEKEKSKEPKALPDEKLDEVAGGLNFAKIGTNYTGTTTVNEGTLNVAVGDVNNDGPAVKSGDGSVKPAT